MRSNATLPWLLADLALVLLALHVLGALGVDRRWYMLFIRAAQATIDIIVNNDQVDLYVYTRILALIWLWVSLFRCFVFLGLVCFRRWRGSPVLLKRLFASDVLAALFVVPLYVR